MFTNRLTKGNEVEVLFQFMRSRNNGESLEGGVILHRPQVDMSKNRAVLHDRRHYQAVDPAVGIGKPRVYYSDIQGSGVWGR